ncbi:MAG: hypothetical protein WD768_12640 [Phycisphaeraceae bacterium]
MMWMIWLQQSETTDSIHGNTLRGVSTGWFKYQIFVEFVDSGVSLEESSLTEVFPKRIAKSAGVSVLSALLFVTIPFVISRDRTPRDHCTVCNYDLRGTPSDTCPECGAKDSRKA